MNRSRSDGVVLMATVVGLAVVVAFPAFAASPPVAEWARTATCNSGDSYYDGGVAIDAQGNLYAAGVIRTRDVVDFGNGVTARDPKPESWNAVLVKYSAGGEAQWARSVATGANDSAFVGVAVDSTGNLYVAGYIGKGTYDFGNGVVAIGHSVYLPLFHDYSGVPFKPRAGNLILVKYNSSGLAQWARTVRGSTDQSIFEAVAVDFSGSVYCVGKIGKGTYDFGDGITVTAGPDTDGSVVVAKYDSTGVIKWARTVPARPGQAWEVQFYAVAPDSAGNIYAAGRVGRADFDFGNGVRVKLAAGQYSSLLVKYDPNGVAQWARTGGVGPERFTSVTVDPAGNVYAGGTIVSNLPGQFGNGVSLTVPGMGSQVANALLVKYDSTGAALWTRSITQASHSSMVAALACDPAGNVYAAGWVYRDGAFVFGGDVTVKGPYWGSERTQEPGRNAFIVTYDSSGTTRWAQSAIQSASHTDFWSLAIDGDGHILAAGGFQGGTVGFGPGVTVSAGSTWGNALLVKY